MLTDMSTVLMMTKKRYTDGDDDCCYCNKVEWQPWC